MKDILVKGCQDCPFRAALGYDNEIEICNIGTDNGGLNNVIAISPEPIEGSPNWCPLKQEAITIKLQL